MKVWKYEKNVFTDALIPLKFQYKNVAITTFSILEIADHHIETAESG